MGNVGLHAEANVRISAAPSGIPGILGAAFGRRIGAAGSTDHSTPPTRLRHMHSGGVSVTPPQGVRGD
jgi:hypothetical protein